MEAQMGAVPGFYASQSAQNEAKGETHTAFSALLDPDRWLPVKGLIVGGRIFGNSGDRPLEPYLGYRRRLIEGVSLGVVGFGSTKRVEKYASYHGFRLGGEAMVDVELYAYEAWLRIHAQGAVAATRIVASGRYCVDAQGVGIDCSEEEMDNTIISGKFEGVFSSGTAQLVVDVGRHQGVFDSARLALLGSAGQMPLLLGGQEQGNELYYAIGLSLTVALGLGRAADSE